MDRCIELEKMASVDTKAQIWVDEMAAANILVMAYRMAPAYRMAVIKEDMKVPDRMAPADLNAPKVMDTADLQYEGLQAYQALAQQFLALFKVYTRI